MAKLSPEEIATLRTQFTKNRERLKELAPEMFASNPEDPIQTDIWAGADGEGTSPGMNRAGSSFGNDEGNFAKLKSLGFKDAKRNQAGDIVVQKGDGKWYRDLPAGWDSPSAMIRGAESGIGHALPAIGGIAGAGLGAGAALPADVATLNPGPSVVGGVVGGGAGTALGEGLRAGAGSYMGFYKPSLPNIVNDVGNAALYGMGAEAGGQAIMKIPGVGKGINWATNKGMDLARKGIATTSSMATGVPREAVERLIARPWDVMKPPSNADLAQQVNEELTSRYPGWSEDLLGARKRFMDTHAETPRSTQPQIDAIRGTMANTPISSTGRGLLPPSQRQEMEDFITQELTTPQRAEQMAPNAVRSRMEFGPEQELQPAVQFTPTKTEYGRGGIYGSQKVPRILPASVSKEGKAVAETVAPPVTYSPWTGHFINDMPERRAGDLLPMADELGAEQSSNFAKNPMTRRTPLDDATDMRVRSLTKGDLHTLDPGLESADRVYSRHKNDRKILGGMGFGSEARQESAASSMASGVNKTAQREALGREAPDVYNTGAKDRWAYEDFGQDSPLRGWLPTARSALWGTLAGSGRMATGHGLLDSAGIAAGALAASSPKAHFYTLGLGSKLVSPWTKALRQNGLRALEGPLVGAPKQTPWRIKFMNEDEDQK